jgi:hypothetical protein
LQTSFSAGVDVSVLELEGAQMSTAKIAGSFPALRDGHLEAPARVTWKNWETVELVPYEKRAFGAMEKVFLEQNGVEQVQTGRSLRAAGDGVRGTAGAANASR